MYEEVKEENNSKDESDMELKAQEYLGQYQDMLHKYQYLLLKQSQVIYLYIVYLKYFTDYSLDYS